jgi:SAM-dependent methyltransferase
MWRQFGEILRCPLCLGTIAVQEFGRSASDLHIELGTAAGTSPDYVEDGQLLCLACHVRYPIARGLPVMLPYSTASHQDFANRWRTELRATPDFRFPDRKPVPGEDYVRASFSTEWLEYDYDGIIWELSYQDHATRFAKEVGSAVAGSGWFLEIGCGLGLATEIAQAKSERSCVGMDLSLAVLKATRQFRNNPHLHFVQASAFSPPFSHRQFEVLYSRGVLHHTYSTEAAFNIVAPLCKEGGTFFLWLYGPGSIRETPLRVALYALESATRPAISRAPNSPGSRLFLSSMAIAYVAFNRSRRLLNSEIQPLTFRRAIHAARDRFTPRFAHRHSAEEVCSWFERAGFLAVTVLDWRDMPAADQDDFRRNIGVRAVRERG